VNATNSYAQQHARNSNGLGMDFAERGATDAAKIRGGPPQPLSKRKPLITRTANAGRLQEVQGPFRQRDQVDLANAKAYDQYILTGVFFV